MQSTQKQPTMQRPEKSSTNNMGAEHHKLAGELCAKASEEYGNASKACATGDQPKANEHAKNAKDHCVKALDHGKQAQAT